MARKKRVRRPDSERLRACETHLYYLWEAICRYRQQPERFKQIAAELRVLVCETRANKPLLLDLMDQYGFHYDVDPPGPPFDKMPIAMVGWKDDPAHQTMSQELEKAAGDPKKLKGLLEQQSSLRRSIPLREFVNNALAVYIAPHDYSYRELSLALAQQMGSSHEDETVEEPLVKMKQVMIGNDPGHLAPLLPFGELIVRVGREFLGFMVSHHSYEPQFFSR